VHVRNMFGSRPAATKQSEGSSVTTVGTKANSTGAEPASSATGAPESPQSSEQSSSERLEPTSLQIVSVRWGRTVNTGNYSSVRLDVEAYVPTGGDPEFTLEALDRWVREHLPLSDSEESDLRYDTRRLINELADLEGKVARARGVYENIKRFSEVNGVELPATGLEDLPF